jgi:3-oxoacyl-[acyl-carrier protein] reductase
MVIPEAPATPPVRRSPHDAHHDTSRITNRSTTFVHSTKDFAMSRLVSRSMAHSTGPRLAGKVALVTGAAQGIGAGIARRFAAEGAAVVVHHNGDAQGAARVVADIVWRGGRAIAAQGDVTHWPDVRRLFEDTVATFGGLDILVNSAGFAAPVLQPGTFAHDDVASSIESNMFGTMLMCQEAIRLFGAAGGSIINLTSSERCDVAPGMLPELAHDAAVDTLTRGLARAFGPRNVRVHAIALGASASAASPAINVLDGSVVNPGFITVPASDRRRAPAAIAELAVSLTGNRCPGGSAIMIAGG